jgi:hypothetical protein
MSWQFLAVLSTLRNSSFLGRQTLDVLHEALHRHSSVNAREIQGSLDLAGDPRSGRGGQTDAKVRHRL